MTALPAPTPVVVRDRIVAELARRMTAVRSVEAHGGTFDLDEVKRFALAAPAVRVAMLGLGRVSRYGTGELLAPVNFAAVCVARDEAKAGVGVIPKDIGCAAIAAQAALIVDGNRWGWSAEPGAPGMVGAPDDLQAENLYSGQIDKTGVALWQVTWTQTIRLGANRNEAIAALDQLIVNGEAFVEGADPVAHPAGGEA